MQVRARSHASREGRTGDGARTAGAGGVPLTLKKAGPHSFMSVRPSQLSRV